MATSITNYQCPACTGPLHFAGDSGRLECDYCGSSYSVEEIEKLFEAKEAASVAAEQKTEAAPSDGWDAEHMKSYSCPSCGAELVCDETTAATSCPYCGNPGIIAGQFADMLRPDYVLPFALDKEAAVSALRQHYKGKLFLPRAFADENHIDEIKGVYVPFWLFDCEVDADLSFDATKVRTYMLGKEQITETDHFNVRRAGTVSFRNIPAEGSSKMPDPYMDSIEPFDFTQMKEFSTAYLPGYLADKYDVSEDECAARVTERASNTAQSVVENDVTGYTTRIPTARSMNMRRDKAKYALLPVWMLSTQWNGKNFLFAMNGQTGKLIGDLPVSWAKIGLWFGGMTAALTALLTLLIR